MIAWQGNSGSADRGSRDADVLTVPKDRHATVCDRARTVPRLLSGGRGRGISLAVLGWIITGHLTARCRRNTPATVRPGQTRTEQPT